MTIFLEYSPVEIGIVVAIWAATKILGALIFGTMSDKWGRKPALYLVMIGGGFFTAMLIFADTWAMVAIIYAIIGIFHGGQYASLGALLMDVTNPKVGATQYSILTSLGNIGMTAGESYSGTMIAVLGFSRTFLYGAWVFGPALLLLYVIKLKIPGKKAENS